MSTTSVAPVWSQPLLSITSRVGSSPRVASAMRFMNAMRSGNSTAGMKMRGVKTMPRPHASLNGTQVTMHGWFQSRWIASRQSRSRLACCSPVNRQAEGSSSQTSAPRKSAQNRNWGDSIFSCIRRPLKP